MNVVTGVVKKISMLLEGKHSNKKEMHLRNDETDGIKQVGVREK